MESNVERAPGTMPNSCTLKEYRKQYAPEHLRKNVVNLALVGYVLSVANLAMGIWNSNVIQIGVAAVLLVLDLGLHLNKSKFCAVAILVTACLDLLLSAYTGGSLTNWGWIALGFCAIGPINEMDKAFKKEIQRRNREN